MMRPMVRGAGWTAGVLVVLGCAGMPELPTGQPAELEEPLLMVLAPSDTGCSWTVHSPSNGASEEIWDTEGDCPTEVLWHPNGERVVTVGEDGVGRQEWLGDGAAKQVSMPDLKGERRGPWLPPDHDGLRVAVLVDAEVKEVRARRVFQAGDLRVTAYADEDSDGAVAYSVRGSQVLLPGKGDRDVWLPSWGLDAIAVFFDRQRDGTWKQVAALPTRYAAGDTPGIDVGGPLVERARTPSWSRLKTWCGRLDCGAPVAWSDRDELIDDLGGLDDGDAPGFLPGGDGGWLFKVVFGDTPHGHGPVLWCADDACDDRTPLGDVPEDEQLSLDVRNDLLLVAEEYTQAAPAVYRAGETAPVDAWPDASSAAWLPKGGLPGVP